MQRLKLSQVKNKHREKNQIPKNCVLKVVRPVFFT